MLHYPSCWKTRRLELMIITQFLNQGHDVLSLDMHPSSRVATMKNFMDSHKHYENLCHIMGQQLAKEEANMLRTRRVANEYGSRGCNGAKRKCPMNFPTVGTISSLVW